VGWLPTVGFAGAAMGGLACGLGIPSFTRWYDRAGYGPWGISGIILGVMALGLSLAYQIKHASGGLDGLLFPLRFPLAWAVFIVSAALTAIGLAIGRRSRVRKITGELLAFVAIATLSLSTTWVLITADRDLAGSEAAHISQASDDQ
jgi:hypothetical protein